MNAAVVRHRRTRATRRRAALFVAVMFAVLALAGPGSGSSYTIQAKNFAFVAPGGGSGLTVVVGSQVTWVASGDPHSVTSGTPGAADHRFADHPASGGLLTPGETFSTTFAAPGTYPYFCEIHPEQMSGVVNVIARTTNSATPAPATPVPTKAPTPRPTARSTAPSSGPPSYPSTIAVVPTPSVSPTTAASGDQPVDSGGTGAASAETPTIAVVAALGILALAAAGALALGRGNPDI